MDTSPLPGVGSTYLLARCVDLATWLPLNNRMLVIDVSRGPHELVQFDCPFALLSSTVRTGSPDNHLGHTMEHNASSFKTFSLFFPFFPPYLHLFLPFSTPHLWKPPICSVSRGSVFLDSTYKYDYTVFIKIFFCLTYLTCHKTIQVHPCCYR